MRTRIELSRARRLLGPLGLLTLSLAPASAQAQAAAPPPQFELEQGQAALVWERDNGGRLQANASLRQPTLRVVREANKRPQPAAPAKSSRSAVSETSPVARVDRVAIRDGAVLLVQGSLSGRELLRVYELELTLENFSTRQEDSGGRPTMLTGRGRIGREGRITFSVKAQPWTEKVNFAGRAELVGVEVKELGGLVTEHASLLPAVGTLAAVTEFSVNDGRITGEVRPTLTGLPADWVGAAEDWARDWAGRQGFELPGRKQDAARAESSLSVVVPLGGTVDDPEAGVGAALLNVLEQALVGAVSVAFPELPPGLDQFTRPGD